MREIAGALPISRPAVSRHLRLLKEAGLVVEEPRGTRRIYRLHDEGLAAVQAYLDAGVGRCRRPLHGWPPRTPAAATGRDRAAAELPLIWRSMPDLGPSFDAVRRTGLKTPGRDAAEPCGLAVGRRDPFEALGDP